MAFHLASPSFEPDHDLPARFTCEGPDVSPPLEWADPPEGTKSFALVVDDPDAPDPRAPKMTWVHWVLYNLPADARALPEGVSAGSLPQGTREGRNDWKQPGWRGPAPPIGKHRYFFKLFALDTTLADLGEAATKRELESAMAGHILGTATIVGTYQKKG
jgi:Raf kinase inhibitor-like YbhB/YbcL family protein